MHYHSSTLYELYKDDPYFNDYEYQRWLHSYRLSQQWGVKERLWKNSVKCPQCHSRFVDVIAFLSPSERLLGKEPTFTGECANGHFTRVSYDGHILY